MPVQERANIQTFLDYLKFEKRYSAHTLLAYTNDLTDFFDFLEIQYGIRELREIQSGIVRSWLASLKDKGLGAVTLNRKISSLKSFFKYQLKTGGVEQSPMGQVISPKKSKRLPVFVKEEEVRELVQTLSGAAEDWKSLNMKMLVAIFYATGMRLSELTGLKETQVDESRGQIKVLGKGNKERVIPVSPELMAAIREYQQLKRKEFEQTGETLLVTEKGKKLYPRYAWALVNQALGEASTLDKKSPHVLRHSFATHLMNHGADLNAVKELLGHSSLAATQVYTHNTIGKLKDIHKKAHPRG
ncbi:MAG TPA: tyrosine-type recombinase/integrase [Chitinophagaceae bacterium]|nr:tyrosine-type recombinase/integrase [Chitinophagaceae bacterium]HPH30238.1 tyrosine-type recombinase/integrase [Chitinophagaceae bacterium]HPN58140.1 tyrosine-type recombinase/integrase [Chitinophagaceae bacterium]